MARAKKKVSEDLEKFYSVSITDLPYIITIYDCSGKCIGHDDTVSYDGFLKNLKAKSIYISDNKYEWEIVANNYKIKEILNQENYDKQLNFFENEYNVK